MAQDGLDLDGRAAEQDQMVRQSNDVLQNDIDFIQNKGNLDYDSKMPLDDEAITTATKLPDLDQDGVGGLAASNLQQIPVATTNQASAVTSSLPSKLLSKAASINVDGYSMQ